MWYYLEDIGIPPLIEIFIGIINRRFEPFPFSNAFWIVFPNLQAWLSFRHDCLKLLSFIVYYVYPFSLWDHSDSCKAYTSFRGQVLGCTFMGTGLLGRVFYFSAVFYIVSSLVVPSLFYLKESLVTSNKALSGFLHFCIKGFLTIYIRYVSAVLSDYLESTVIDSKNIFVRFDTKPTRNWLTNSGWRHVGNTYAFMWISSLGPFYGICVHHVFLIAEVLCNLLGILYDVAREFLPVSKSTSID